MKGIILAGGLGSRLFPITKVTNKHLLPIFNKPMIYYPLYSMKEAGITEVVIVSGPEHCGHFLSLLGSGSELGMKISYEVQEKPGGIAQALGLTKTFVGNEKIVVILGDNIYEDSLKPFVEDFAKRESGATVLLKKVANPSAYGVAMMEGEKIKIIIEKPSTHIGDFAVTGCYMYDNRVFDVVANLKPSARGELEITDVNNFYLSEGSLKAEVLEGFWGDCGESFEGMLSICNFVKDSRLAEIDAHLNLCNAREHASLVEDVQASFIESNK